MNPSGQCVTVLDTACTVTDTERFIETVRTLIMGRVGVVCVDFTNVQIVTQRRTDPEFRRVTDTMDFFVPDSQVLVWAVRLLGGKGAARAYGPSFLRACIRHTPAPCAHYFLGGSPECLEKLQAALRTVQPDLRIAGAHHGYFNAEEEPAIVAQINHLQPDIIWVGLGTPRQQEWMQRNRSSIRSGIMMAVGFAFDVNAATKKDAPAWMGRLGLTWLFRLAREPRRLFWRYCKYNTLFVWFLGGQFLRRLLGGGRTG